MPIAATVHADFTCDKCSKTIPLSYRREDTSASLETSLHACIDGANKKGWRVRVNQLFIQDLVLCPRCDKKHICDHGDAYGSCRVATCTHRREGIQ